MLRLHTLDCLCRVAMKRRIPCRDAEQVSIHRWFFIHDQVLVAINPLPVYGLALEHAWNTIRRAKRRKSDALRFKFQTSSAGAVPRTSPFSSWTQYCEPEMLNYGVTLASFFFMQSNKIDLRASLFKPQSKKKTFQRKTLQIAIQKKKRIWEENLSHFFKKKQLFNSK